jgi:hypothetical protein
MQINVDIFGDEFQDFLEMRIHRMDTTWSEKLKYMEIGTIFVAMIDSRFQLW